MLKGDEFCVQRCRAPPIKYLIQLFLGKENEMKKNGLYRRNKKRIRLLMSIILLCLNKMSVSADVKKTATSSGNIGSTKLVTGTVNLLNDISASLMVISPLAGAVLAAYFFVRKNAADETDQKQWDKRIKLTICCVIGAEVISGIITAVTGYYK